MDKELFKYEKRYYNGLLILMFSAIAIITQIVYVDMHENVHKEIAIMHGCLDPKINYGWFGITERPHFICTSYIDVEDEVMNQERMLHAQNEIVGYSVYPILLAIILSAYAIAMTTMNSIFYLIRKAKEE